MVDMVSLVHWQWRWRVVPGRVIAGAVSSIGGVGWCDLRGTYFGKGGCADRVRKMVEVSEEVAG